MGSVAPVPCTPGSIAPQARYEAAISRAGNYTSAAEYATHMRAEGYYGYQMHLVIASAIYHVDILVYQSRVGRGFRLMERYVPRAWASAVRCCVGAKLGDRGGAATKG